MNQAFFIEDAALRAALACPACRGALAGLEAPIVDGVLTCTACHAGYAVRGGVAILLADGADSAHDEALAHAHGRQQRYFDAEVAAEFETTRPHGAPWAYRALMQEKFRRSVAALPPVRDATVVDVCAGSGMDAEMLARRGARVLAIDLSEGCVRRAIERSRRTGVRFAAVVGDAGRLPLRDASADIAYVHDGLHHLEEPLDGVRELARVARRAVSINEPADAAITRAAVRLGISQQFEDAGNRIARMRAAEVVYELRRYGFAQAQSSRYAMYYKHQPGRLLHIASRAPAQPLFRAGLRMATAASARWGNKLQVTARKAA